MEAETLIRKCKVMGKFVTSRILILDPEPFCKVFLTVDKYKP